VRKIEKNLGLVVSALQVEVAALRTQLNAYQNTLKQSTAMVQDTCSTMRMTVQASVTRQQSTTCTVNAKLDEQSRQVAQVQETQQEILLLLKQQLQQQQNQNFAMARSQQLTVEVAAAGGDGVGNLLPLKPEAQPIEVVDGDAAAVSFATAHARRAQEMGYDAVGMLRSTPRTPAIDKFPKDWPAFLAEWQNNDLDAFKNSNKAEWGCTALTQKYVKRSRGIKVLRKFMLEYKCHDEVEAAGKLETFRDIKKVSLSTHIMQLFSSDGDVKRRIRIVKSAMNIANNSNTDSLAE
jgi:hypothetical protein